jgi:subtilisin family serine protease
VKLARPCVQTVVLVFIVLFVTPHLSAAGSPSAISSVPGLSAALERKAASGNLFRHIARKLASSHTVNSARPMPSIMAAIYASLAPSTGFLAQLASKGVRAFPETWTPPSANHPRGYFLAQIPIAAVTDVLALDGVEKMDTAENESVPMSNEAARAIKADVAWAMGTTGTGVKVGVLDSGVDISFAGTELPASFPKRDYSLYPEIDTIVANTVIGHGTHVAGIVLSRGMLSPLNTGNGGGAYKGMAPGADLVFLKIGLDGSAGATDAAEIAAIHSAVDTFHVRVLNLSYGGWDTYHDGSNIISQAIDWAYNSGVSCFVAAGNFGNAARHASGYVIGHDTSDFIQVNVGASTQQLQLEFNLVWSDGPAHNNLSLLYYNSAKTLLTDVSHYMTTESPRGVESQYSLWNTSFINQPGTYYLRVVNPSAATQVYHLYESYNGGSVQFAFPDPNSTITTPGDADNAFTVGAYSTHEAWTGIVTADVFHTGIPLGTIASFSSRGPRIDGVMKPNIAAPGCMLISLRDRDVYSSPSDFCIDDDGTPGGSADYYVMQGTSMASPVCAGAAALLYQQSPQSTPRQIYDALMQQGTSDASTGTTPNTSWGFGKLNVYASLQNFPLPVELTAFSSTVHASSVVLNWSTATETNNYGFAIERQLRSSDHAASAPANGEWMTIGFVAGSGTTAAPHEYSYVDRYRSSATAVYRLKQTDKDGRFTYSKEVEVASQVLRPSTVSLAQNYPNPFNPTTNIGFSIPSAALVRLSVFDVLGREVAIVVNRQMDPGSYTETWNASGVPSGVYFYRLEAGSHQEIKKLMVQK